jgi:hypothetical protein
MLSREVVEELKGRCGINDRAAWAFLAVWEKECGPVKNHADLARLVTYVNRRK